jgi:hypothetical protein
MTTAAHLFKNWLAFYGELNMSRNDPDSSAGHGHVCGIPDRASMNLGQPLEINGRTSENE